MIAPNASHSAHVDMHLLLADRRLPLSQLGPDFAILADDVSLPPTGGEIELIVDGNVSRWSVRLDDGINEGNRRFRFRTVPSTF